MRWSVCLICNLESYFRDLLLKINNLNFTFYPAGHILGSAQILIETKNRRLLITGDYKTSPDSSCQSYELVECDQLITEATFGLPVFQHPKPENEIKKILKAFEKNDTKTYIIGAYALGKSQRVIKAQQTSTKYTFL